MTRISIAIRALVLCAAAMIGSVELTAQNRVAAALNAYRPPTPVVDVNEAAKKPVAYWTKLYFPGAKEPKEEYPGELPKEQIGRAVYLESEDFFVPEGRVLVLEYANAVACYGPDGEKMSIGIKTNYNRPGSAPANLKIVLTEQGIFDEPEEGVYMHAGSSQQMKIYIRGGDSFRLTAWRSGAATHAEAEFWLTGYLMPAK
jgi:hypothetical protein